MSATGIGFAKELGINAYFEISSGLVGPVDAFGYDLGNNDFSFCLVSRRALHRPKFF
jgi:hypothetical protein